LVAFVIDANAAGRCWRVSQHAAAGFVLDALGVEEPARPAGETGVAHNTLAVRIQFEHL
jgi:hypothetical protein